ncbi:MAG: hypothetical protein CMH54_03165 [Myxococcales bacterium]|nr:hypothetical protein [Myxococcales bacterium]
MHSQFQRSRIALLLLLCAWSFHCGSSDQSPNDTGAADTFDAISPDSNDTGTDEGVPDEGTADLHETIDSSVDINDTSAPDVPVEEDTAPPLPNPMYTVGDDCAIPTDYSTASCLVTSCVGGHICMGDGYCVPEGPFLLVPDDPNASQVKPSLALSQNGGFAAAWYSVTHPPGGGTQTMDIQFQRFAADGTPLAQPIKIDQDALIWARSPTITRMQNGGYLIAWRSQEGGNGEIRYMARVISHDGHPIGDAFQLNETPLTTGFTTGNVDSPFPTLLRSGKIAITWMGYGGIPSQNQDVFLRLLSADGQPETGELLTGAATSASEVSSIVTDTSNGGVAIFWQHIDNSAGIHEIRGRIFNANAQPAGVVFTASPGTEPDEWAPSATTFPGGNILLTWRVRETPNNSGPNDIYSTLLGPNGEDMGSPIHLVGHDPSGGYPFYAPTDENDPFRAAVVWHSLGAASNAVYLRRYYQAEDIYDCEPTDLSGPLMDGETGGRHLPAVLAFPDGRILAVWSTGIDNANGDNISRAVLRYVK